MLTRMRSWVVMWLVGVALLAGWGLAGADEVPLVTGEQWTRSSPELKKAYLLGFANLVQIETAYYAANPPPDTQNFVPRVARGLKGQTLDSARDGLDRWYAAHPERLSRPVLETLWFELVVPGLKTSK